MEAYAKEIVMRPIATNARAGVAAKNNAGPWFLASVHRDDAEGELYAAISATNGREYDVAPTYDRGAMLRFVQQLNGIRR